MIEEMKKLGFTEYEVKAYTTLLKHYPINGYGLSKHSMIPRSRVYEVLDGLKEKGVVFEQQDGKSKLFTPLDPKLLIERLKHDYNRIIEDVKLYTEKLYDKNEIDYEVKVIKGRSEIMQHISLLLKSAKRRVAVSIWDEELSELKNDIDVLKEKGVQIRGVYFGKDNPYEDLIEHRRVERYIAEKNERYIILIIDDTDVISGKISTDNISRVMWSQDPTEIDMKDDFIAHDVMINKYATQLEDRKGYEKALDLIRKDYFIYTEEEYETFKDA